MELTDLEKNIKADHSGRLFNAYLTQIKDIISSCHDRLNSDPMDTMQWALLDGAKAAAETIHILRVRYHPSSIFQIKNPSIRDKQ